MNSQTITTRANAKHFSQNSTPKANVAAANVSAAPPVSETMQEKKVEQKAAAQAKTAPKSAAKPAAAQVETHFNSPHSDTETSFRVDAPAAHEVLLVGEFTQWEKAPLKLIKGGGGVWHTKVALAPGRHLYRFLVDGQWQDDAHRPGREPNSFGSSNCVVEVV